MNKSRTPDYRLIIAFFVPVITASLIRFWDIDLRPLHSDEGVNSFFLRNLFEKNDYHYNPANYHGPFLYYIGLIPFYFLGVSDFSFRLLPVLFGIMVVALIYPLRRRLGWAGTLTTGLLIAISPADSFFSRDTIHETYLVFFTLSTVVSFFLYSESRKARYIYFATASIAFTVTIKETYIITFAIYGLSLGLAYLCCGLRVATIKPLLRAFGSNCASIKYTIAINVAIFLFINFLFYSSFFTYYEGVNGALTTLAVWTKTGTHSGGHVKPFVYYFTILRKYELPILVMGLCGFYYACKDNRKFAFFVAFWAILIFLAYSLIPYKTPWLIVNMTIPLAVSGGMFINGVYRRLTERKRWPLAIFYPIYALLFLCFSYQSVVTNFIDYDDDRSELVYVQTTRDIYNLLDTLERLTDSTGKDITINVIAKSYWPLPWYLREYKNAKFWGRNISNPNAPIILADRKNKKDLDEKLKGGYRTKQFGLRPGVWIVAYIQKGLYDTVYGDDEIADTSTPADVTQVTRDELKPGLQERCYYNIECQGAPFRSGVKTDPIVFAYHDLSKKPYRSPFGIEWEGYISIRKEGIYQFATKSDDGSEVYIDGDVVVDNGGFHASRYISGMVRLDEGFHHVKVNYFDGGGGAVMEWLWTQPGSHEVVVPGASLFHRSDD